MLKKSQSTKGNDRTRNKVLWKWHMKKCLDCKKILEKRKDKQLVMLVKDNNYEYEAYDMIWWIRVDKISSKWIKKFFVLVISSML